MSRYTTYYLRKQNQYRDFAISWAKTASNMNLTERQKRGMALFFMPMAKRFGLIQEFRNIGII